MTVFLGALLALLSVVVVILPFFRGRQRLRDRVFINPLVERIKGRENIYEAMKSLSLDHEMGDVTDEDFKTQMQAYRLQAAQVLREQNHLSNLEKDIEQEVLDFRKSHGNLENTRLCIECGSPLSAETNACPNCGAEAEGA